MTAYDDHNLPDDAIVNGLAGLMAQRAVTGLDDDETNALQRGVADGDLADADLEAFDELAALACLAVLPADDETPAMPTSLRERLVADAVRVSHGRPATTASADGPVRRDPERADAFIASAASEDAASTTPAASDSDDAAAPTIEVVAPAHAERRTPSDVASRPSVLATIGPWLGWAAAAAILVFAVLPGPAPTDAPLTEARLMALASDAVTIPLNGLEGVADGVRGRIVWSEERQAGVLRVSGLTANNPTDMQYQLWVFDRGRENQAQQHPAVDGGVFDMPAGLDEIEIPIDAKLEVFDPYLFAITSEPAGGVVKHDPELDPERFRIVAAAAVEG